MRSLSKFKCRIYFNSIFIWPKRHHRWIPFGDKTIRVEFCSSDPSLSQFSEFIMISLKIFCGSVFWVSLSCGLSHCYWDLIALVLTMILTQRTDLCSLCSNKPTDIDFWSSGERIVNPLWWCPIKFLFAIIAFTHRIKIKLCILLLLVIIQKRLNRRSFWKEIWKLSIFIEWGL